MALYIGSKFECDYEDLERRCICQHLDFEGHAGARAMGRIDESDVCIWLFAGDWLRCYASSKGRCHGQDRCQQPLSQLPGLERCFSLADSLFTFSKMAGSWSTSGIGTRAV